MTDPRITEITALKAIAEAAERDWDSPIPLMTLRNFHAAASPTIILTLLEALATAEKQITDARRILSLRIDKDECRFDHNHSCQTHSDFYIPQGEKCIERQAKDWLAALTVQDKETPSTSLEAAFFPGLTDQLDALTIRGVDQ